MRGLLRLQSLFFSVFFVFLIVVQGEAQDKNVGRYYEEQSGQEVKTLGYYKDEGRRGWWWYEDPVRKEEETKKREVRKEEAKKEEPKKEETKKEEAKKEEKVKGEEEIKPLYEYSYEELLRMPVDKFKKIYEYYEKLAVSNPTEENL